MQATHLAITGRSFQQARRPWCMGPGGITRRILVPQCGTAGLTPTAWELDSPTRVIPDGASGSATDMPTIPGITRGGDRWDTTDMAGIPITAGEHGEGRRSPVAAPIRTSTRVTQPGIAAVRPTIRTPASSPAAEPATEGTSIAARARPDAVDSPTTRT